LYFVSVKLRHLIIIAITTESLIKFYDGK